MQIKCTCEKKTVCALDIVKQVTEWQIRVGRNDDLSFYYNFISEQYPCELEEKLTRLHFRQRPMVLCATVLI